MVSLTTPSARALPWRWRRCQRFIWPVFLFLTAVLLPGPTVKAETAPAYSATDLATGEAMSLADFRGDVVLLNGWATWCGPCREELPYLEHVHQSNLDDGLMTIGVNLDAGSADERVRAFAADAGVTYPIWRDPESSFIRAFPASGLPQTVLIGRDGEVRFTWKGQMGSNPAGDAAIIAAALAETPPPAVSGIGAVGFGVAFSAGLLSFLSPCVLPLVPGYAAILAGLSTTESRQSCAKRGRRRGALANGVLFVAGFSLVFIALGVTATTFGALLLENRVWIARIGGLLLLVFGLYLLGVLRLPWLERDYRLLLQHPRITSAGAFLIGIAFGAGWTPCIGPALASILTLAAAGATVREGAALLATYSLGLAIPFLLATTALDRFMTGSSRVHAWLPTLQRASGVLTLLIAALLLTDSLTRLSEFASRFGP